jgi:hypothetical protein
MLLSLALVVNSSMIAVPHELCIKFYRPKLRAAIKRFYIDLFLVLASVTPSSVASASQACLDLEVIETLGSPEREGYVMSKVEGLLDSIPIPSELIAAVADPVKYELPRLQVSKDFFVEDRRIGNKFTTKVIYVDPITKIEVSGSVTRKFVDGELELVFASLAAVNTTSSGKFIKMPRWINVPGVVPLLAGKGIPLQMFLTLRQLKIAKIAPGEVKFVKSDIVNSIAVAEYEVARRRWSAANPGKEATDVERNQWIQSMTSLRYIESTLIQMGYRVAISRVLSESRRMPAKLWWEARRSASEANVLRAESELGSIESTGLGHDGEISPGLEIVWQLEPN